MRDRLRIWLNQLFSTDGFRGPVLTFAAQGCGGCHEDIHIGELGPNCEDCHVGNDFSGTPTDCFACHMDDYNGTTDPNHTVAGFSTDCDDCHSTNSWQGARFDHDSWPLTGKHRNADCSACHPGGVFAGTALQSGSSLITAANTSETSSPGNAFRPVNIS